MSLVRTVVIKVANSNKNRLTDNNIAFTSERVNGIMRGLVVNNSKMSPKFNAPIKRLLKFATIFKLQVPLRPYLLPIFATDRWCDTV